MISYVVVVVALQLAHKLCDTTNQMNQNQESEKEFDEQKIYIKCAYKNLPFHHVTCAVHVYNTPYSIHRHTSYIHIHCTIFF